jgi:hypothetical protein
VLELWARWPVGGGGGQYPLEGGGGQYPPGGGGSGHVGGYLATGDPPPPTASQVVGPYENSIT